MCDEFFLKESFQHDDSSPIFTGLSTNSGSCALLINCKKMWSTGSSCLMMGSIRSPALEKVFLWLKSPDFSRQN